MWAIELFDRIAGSFPGFQFGPSEASAWCEWVTDLDPDATSRAAQALMMRPPHRFPSGPEVRRRVLEDLGLFAPSLAEAQRLIREVSAGRLRLGDIPGPARRIDTPLVAELHPRAVEALYAAVAEEHDLVVEAPGGVEQLRLAAEWLAAVRARGERLRLAQQCAADLLDPPALLPGPSTPDEALAGYIDRWKAEHGEVPQLGPVLADADERWTSAPNVVAHVAELKRLARIARNGSA